MKPLFPNLYADRYVQYSDSPSTHIVNEGMLSRCRLSSSLAACFSVYWIIVYVLCHRVPYAINRGQGIKAKRFSAAL